MPYTTAVITRQREGASYEDLVNGDGYEDVYIVYNPDGEIIWDTTDYKLVRRYFENVEEEE